MVTRPPSAVDLHLRVDTWSVYEPLADEPFAGVDVHLSKPLLAGVHELVRNAGGHDHYLPTLHLDLLVANGKGGDALLHNEDLLVGVPVQLGAAARRGVYHYEGDAGAEVVALELALVVASGRIGQVEDARCDPCASCSPFSWCSVLMSSSLRGLLRHWP